MSEKFDSLGIAELSVSDQGHCFKFLEMSGTTMLNVEFPITEQGLLYFWQWSL